MRLTRVLVPAVAALATAAVAVVFTAFDGDGTTADAGGAPDATVEVVRRDLARSEEVDGTLTYGEAITLTGSLSGTVTRLPEVGAVVEAGEALYDVDNRPVVLLDGALPMWRDLAAGTEGPDVEQFEEGLAGLGYDGFTVDGEYTYATAAAVERWQSDTGAPVTGTVARGEVVFGPSAARVASHSAAVGSSASGPVLTYTGADQHVSLDLKVGDRDLAEEDQAVTVTLPDGAEVAGTVAEVGAAVTAAEAEGGGRRSDEEATVEVTVAIDDPAAVGDLESAPVKVELVAETHRDVLVVPIEALLALREGGYGLEVVDGDGTSLLEVETGIFASGLVEVSGAGLEEGMSVVVAE